MVDQYIFDRFRFGSDIHQPITVWSWCENDAIQEALNQIDDFPDDTIQLREIVREDMAHGH